MNASEADPQCDSSPTVLVRPRGRGFDLLVTAGHEQAAEIVDRGRLDADFFAQLAKRSDLLIDIGAQYGFFSLLAAEANPNLQVIAVESDPVRFDVLRQNANLTKPGNIHPKQAGLSAASDKDNSPTLPRSGRNDPLLDEGPAGRLHPEPISVDSLTAARTPKALLIKLTAGGQELAALAGMQETLRRVEDVRLIVEFDPLKQREGGHDPRELLAELDRLGFAMQLISDQERAFFRLQADGNWTSFVSPTGRANIYCVPKKRAVSVLLFCHSAQLGGAERSLIELVDELICDHGVVCTVIVPGDGPMAAALQKAGAAALIQPKLGLWATFEKPPDILALADSLNEGHAALVRSILPQVRRIDPDIVYTQTMVIPWGAVTADLLKKPHIWSICEFGRLDHDLTFIHDFPSLIASIADSSSYILTACNSIREILFPAFDPDRIQTTYRHIPIPDSVTPDDGLFRQAEATHLAIFATLAEGKGQQEAIRAVAELVRRGRDVELLLAGHASTSTHRKQLEDLVVQLGLMERVTLVDFVEDPYPAMAATDILLVCSRHEAFGRAAAEGMLLGRPIVYARSGGIAEYLQDGITGIAYEPGDVNGLVEGIIKLLDDTTKAREMGNAAKRRAQTLFSRDAYGGEIYRIMNRLSRTPQRPVRAPHQLLETLADAVARNREQLAGIQIELSRERQVSEMLRHEMTQALAETQAAVTNREQQLAQTILDVDARDRQLSEALKSLATRDIQLTIALQDIATRDKIIEEKRSDLTTRDLQLAQAARDILVRDDELAKRQAEIAAHDSRLSQAMQDIALRNEALAKKQAEVAARDSRLAQATQDIEARNQDLDRCQRALREAEQSVSSRNRALAETAVALERTQGQLSNMDQTLRSTHAALSWRATSPLRKLQNNLPRFSRSTRRLVKLVWWTVTLQLLRRMRERRQR